MSQPDQRLMRVAVLASGGGSNLQAILDAFGDRGAAAAGTVALVASDRPDAGALARASARGIATAHLSRPSDGAAILTLLHDHYIDIVALAGYLKFVPGEVTRAYHGRVINVHPALLPKHGGPGMYGRRVHAAVLAAGDRESGATVHFVNDEYDRGPIIAQSRVPVLPDDTAETLAARVLRAEHSLYPRVLADLCAGTVRLADDGSVVRPPSPSHS